MAFFLSLSHWREGVVGALRMGLQQGVACLGCCRAPMALAFVGGTMNLVWMDGAMVLMTIEKPPTFGRYIHGPAWSGASGELRGRRLACRDRLTKGNTG